jgi:putative transposase
MIRALLLVARWIAVAHDRWRAETAKRRPLSAEIDALRELVARLRSENDLLRARLRRVPLRRRPRYGGYERLLILIHEARYGLSLRATARAFVLSGQTIVNWCKDVARVPRLVRGRRPLNALPDLVAEIVHRLKGEWPAWGTRRIAGILARSGLRASRTTVQRMLRRPYRPAWSHRAARRRHGTPTVAAHPGHIWIIDFTQVGGLIRSIRVGAIIDACSRKVLAIAAWTGEPPAALALRLLRAAIASSGPPPMYVVTDRGRQFTSRAFRRALARRGVTWRLGRLGHVASLPLVERFWRSLKEEFARGLLLYRSVRVIDRGLAAYRTWFNGARPHQALDQRTPDEVHHGLDTRARSVPLKARLEIEAVAGHRALPVLTLRRAA